MLSIGHENFVKSDAIVSITQPDNAPAKKLRHRADEERMLINATSGRKTRSIIVMNSNHVVLSSIQPKVLNSRLQTMEQLGKS
jgi:regulator of extracellular matrix RemA (YlzA/DUF370 family)